nr:HNH endonuclease family protein [Salinispora cortesiana]
MRTRSGPLLATVLALGLAGCVPATTPEPTPTNDGGSAMEKLAELTVASAGSMKGYSRDRFPHWRGTGKNCDVRDTVLARDGESIKLSGCNVVGGRWESVYDGLVLTDPSEVDVDHMVPLANAWRSGADRWTDAKRGDFANDTRLPHLFAVSRTANRSKGDQDPSQWRPANRSYWCRYAESWVTVKHHWQLSVNTDEKTALADMLTGCTGGSQS